MMEPHKIIMIEDEEGNLLIYTVATTIHRAWAQFFGVNPHKAPLHDAIKAYSTIGYRVIQVELGSIRTIEEQWNIKDGNFQVLGELEPIRGRVV